MTPPDFKPWFRELTGFDPHPWQIELGEERLSCDRLIRIPTGLGKTLGVLAAWSYHRLIRGDDTWPRRLVLCLPMRVLVEQTEAVASDWLRKLGCLWGQETPDPGAGEVGVHLLLGGSSPRRWHLYPEHPAVLVGTQDMLLSRALGRGYAAPRGRWPMEQALLRQDALWVLDEIQLMDVGLRTSTQLQAFAAHKPQAARPLRSWWMSATLQPDWLESVDFAAALPRLRREIMMIPAQDRRGAAFSAHKALSLESIAARDDRNGKKWAQRILDRHLETPPRADGGRLTLAIANTVDDACALYDALAAAIAKATKGAKGSHDEGPAIDLRLIHSRFRGRERRHWRETLLHREACAGIDRIVVATQVVEAGVDISAELLVTALAPWPSLVQRFGRAARYGGEATIIAVDRELTERAAAPYDAAELVAARQVLENLEDVNLATLEALESRLRDKNPQLLSELYPYQPLHTLTAADDAELFDTGPDLTGSELDISRFIRSGDQRDLQVWWWPLTAGERPKRDLQPMRDALCPVPVHRAAEWLGVGRGAKAEGVRRAFAWDYQEGEWRPLQRSDSLRPGQILLVDAAAGGYDPERGFVGAAATKEVPCAPQDRRDCREKKQRSGATQRLSIEHLLDDADNAQGHEELSELEHYKTIAYHGLEADEEARALAAALGLETRLAGLLGLAARLHDLGKAHAVFQDRITTRPADLESRHDLAKAPKEAWASPRARGARGARGPERRPGFRHELASTLAILEALYQACPTHPGLLGRYQPLIEAKLLAVDRQHLGREHPPPPGILGELAALDASDLDLVLYLVCAHHGKVRGSWQATPKDQEAALQRGPGRRGSPASVSPSPGDATEESDPVAADVEPDVEPDDEPDVEATSEPENEPENDNSASTLPKRQPLRGVCDDDPLPATAVADRHGDRENFPAVMLHLDPAALGLSPRYGASWRDRVDGLRARYGDATLGLLESLLRVADARASARVTLDPWLPQEATP